MKFIIFLILVFSCSLSLVYPMGEQNLEYQQVKFNKNLPKPDQKMFLLNKTKQSLRSKEILDQNDWQQFYRSFKPFARELTDRFAKGEDRQPANSEELNDRIWFSYLIAGAPLYKTNLNSMKPWLYGADNDDIRAKANAAAIITSTEPDLVAKQFNIPEEQLRQLNCIYFAAIIKTLRAAYFPDLEKQESKITDEIFEKYKLDEETLQNKFNTLNAMISRSNLIKYYLENFLEKGFLDMLVCYFPGKKGEVIKYIKIAGYDPHEINELIDRTVGREPKTEFLYKGRSKKTTRK